MKKSCLIGMLLLCLVINVFAQRPTKIMDAKQLNMLTLSDSGMMANNLSFSLMLFDFRFKTFQPVPSFTSATSQYITNSLTMGCSYTYANKYKIAAGYSSVAALPEKADEGVINSFYPGMPSDGSRRREHAELSFTRYFRSYITEKITKIKIKKEQGINYFVNIPCHKLTLIGWNVEVIGYKTSANNYDFNFKGYDITDPKKTIIELPWSYSVVNMDMAWVNIGASITNIVDTRYDIKEYGKRKRHHISIIYADIIIAPYMHYGDVQGYVFQYPQTPTDVYHHVNVNDNTPHYRLGCKVGYTYFGNGILGAGFGAEAGISPGPKINPYLSLRAYIPVFNFKV